MRGGGGGEEERKREGGRGLEMKRCSKFVAPSVYQYVLWGFKVQRGYWSGAILSLLSSTFTFFLWSIDFCVCAHVSVYPSQSLLSLPLFLSLFWLCVCVTWFNCKSDSETQAFVHAHKYTHPQTHRKSSPSPPTNSHSTFCCITDLLQWAGWSQVVLDVICSCFFFIFCFSFLAKNIPVGSPSRFVNLHLVSARCWDAPVRFRGWLRASERGRVLLLSLIRCNMPLAGSFLLLVWDAGAPLWVFE